ncbi:hypothetical protein GON26_12715 [Flavobacterium sp. GA093]|uniref:Tetratricopeptide repeat protein n=1 Tax=Flavobacterium hydrocarbonoxydans TaxID=2683249 RepID=A0A6I4NLG3_9FLAO|nr:tetratricopeptide repeat protein [Flavobacterium hydrocarbonoxydans]MWB95226.1 hypothetical protein [Flavobacterium hydrocarbonoxydans]
MNVTTYTYLINHPDAITEQHTDALGNVLNEFPYFQSARALRLKGLHSLNSFKYNYALKVTAAHTTDRAVLFDFITSENFTAIQNEYYDQKLKHLLNITVLDSEIVSAETIRKTEDIRIDPLEQSLLTSIKEATTVTFEEPSFREPIFVEVTKITEEPEATLEVTPEIAPEPIQTITTTTTVDESVKETTEETTQTSQEVLPVIEEINETIEEPTLIAEGSTVEETSLEETSLEEISLEEISSEETTFIAEKEIKAAEEHLEIGKPLDFSANEKHSFQEWLQLAKTEPIDRSAEPAEELKPSKIQIEEEVLDEEKKKKAEIIDKFIETNPKISPIKSGSPTVNVHFDINKEENSYLMTETLARVYLEQKKYTKAIQAYEILILKYPEKISFFADRISDIKILQQNNNNNN